MISGIGQGFWVTTPLQLAAATTATARRGNFIEPHFSVLEDVDAGARASRHVDGLGADD